MTKNMFIFIYMHPLLIKRTAGLKKLCWCGADAGLTCAGAGRVRVQLVLGGAGAGTEFKFICGLSQARGPAGRVRA